MKIAILISGRGSNMQALLKACADPDFPADVVEVISNRPDAAGIAIAETFNVPTLVIDHTHFGTREEFEDALHDALVGSGAELLCLAGFMRLLGADFIGRWRDKIINVHPSLLPAYRGLHTHERALEDGVRFTGCTIHFVRPEMDNGPIIFQACVPVLPDDTEQALEARVLEWEHKLYPLVVRLLSQGRLRVSGGQVMIDGPIEPQDGLMSPLIKDD
ncbi:MAG: phosphoribosylglycinamide formyltransferase [Alphaproteobacteria bacterium]